MSKILHPPILIVGVGNEQRHDDAAGLLVVRRIAQLIKPSSEITTLEIQSDGTALVQAWQNASSVILIDAVSQVDEPGTILYYDAHEQKLPIDIFSSSTHTFGAIEAIEFTRTVDKLPDTMIIYGIVGQMFTPGKGLSPKVQQTVDILPPILAEWVQSSILHPAM